MARSDLHAVPKGIAPAISCPIDLRLAIATNQQLAQFAQLCQLATMLSTVRIALQLLTPHGLAVFLAAGVRLPVAGNLRDVMGHSAR
jgi:hypothetical protein